MAHLPSFKRHPFSRRLTWPARAPGAWRRWGIAMALGLAGCAAPQLPSRPAADASTTSAPDIVSPTLPAAPPLPLPVEPPPAPAQTQPLAALPYGEAVAARFPEPGVAYRTPAFAPGHDAFTSNAELQAQLRSLVRGDSPSAPSIRLLPLGTSQRGEALEALLFSRATPTGADTTAPRPVVLLVGQQHGDEPAGGEALLVIAQQLAQGDLAPLLEQLDVIVLPRANPDGAAAGQRVTANGIDANRDHLLLRTPEAQAIAALVREYRPVVVVDAHEYTVVGRYLEKFGTVQRFDALVQHAMTANLPEFITRAADEWFRQPMRSALGRERLSSEWYYTTSTDPADKKVSMGGVQPDTGRNVNGLKNAVSLLIETRGVGIGRLHFKRRVHTHVTALRSALHSAAGRSADLLKLRQYVDREVAARACRGEVVVEAAATPSEYVLTMIAPATGADVPVNVAWDSALTLQAVKTRARPCGYWLAADQVDAVRRLGQLGVQVQQIDEAGSVRGETYRETARGTAQRQDVRGSIADGGGALLRLQVALQPELLDLAAGGYYVGLDQPLANLVVAALEPDTQNSYAANRIVSTTASVARVLVPPEMRLVRLP